MILEIVNVMAPLLVLAGIGFVWGWRGKPFPVESVSLMVTNIGTPCLVLGTLFRGNLDHSQIGSVGLAAVVAVGLFLFIGYGLLRLLGLPWRSFLPTIAFPNAGNAGLSLSLFAFGQQGLALAIIYFAVSSLSNFTLGQAIYAGRGNWREVAGSPMIYAVVLAVAGNLLDFHPPLWLQRSLDVAGGIAIPMMLITLGVSLARLKVNDIKSGIIVALIRLLLGIAVGVGISELFGFTGTLRGIFILQCAMPVAVVNYIFAVRYNRDAGGVAGVVVVSTLLGFAVMPLILAFVMRG